jgi:hypothetical protein
VDRDRYSSLVVRRWSLAKTKPATDFANNAFLSDLCETFATFAVKSFWFF